MNNTNNDVFERLGHIHKMNINLPFEDEATIKLYDFIINSLNVKLNEEEDSCIIDDMPFYDILNVVMDCSSYCYENKYNINILTSLMSVFDTFKNLKYISLTFKKNSKLLEYYNIIVDTNYKGSKSEIFNKLYDITELEINLSSHFDIETINKFNEILIFYGYIENDYFKRRFTINFEFDEYISFINMVFKGKNEVIEKFGIDFIDYLVTFPTCVARNKPKVRLVTNYSEL